MGLFKNLRKQLRKSIQPSIGSIRTPDNFVLPPPMDEDRISPLMRGPGLNPRNAFDGVFISKPKIIDYIPGKRPSSPRPRQTIEELLASRPGIKKVEKRSGLGGLLRRLQEQIRNQQMRMPQPIPELRAGEIMPNSPVLDRRPSPPRMPAPPIAVPPGIIPNLDLGMPVMPEERMAPPVMNQMQGQPRMMMSRGRDANMVDFLNSDPQQQIFGIETKIGILENQLQEALANNDRQSYDMIVDQINDADAQRIDIMNSMNPVNSRMMLGESGRTISNMDRDYLDDILSDLEKKN